MHDGEGRHGRSRPYPSLAGRVLIGALMGAFLGLLELWFIGSGSAPSLAVMAADPNVASASGVSLPWAAAERFQEIVLCTSAGSVAYTVWWLIEQPGTSIGRIALAVGAGALLGALFARTSENALPRTPLNSVCLTTARRSRMLLVSDLAKNPATHRRIKIGRVFLELAGGVR